MKIRQKFNIYMEVADKSFRSNGEGIGPVFVDRFFSKENGRSSEFDIEIISIYGFLLKNVRKFLNFSIKFDYFPY